MSISSVLDVPEKYIGKATAYNKKQGLFVKSFILEKSYHIHFFLKRISCFNPNQGRLTIMSYLNAASVILKLPSVFGYGLLVLHTKQANAYLKLMLPSLSMHLE